MTTLRIAKKGAFAEALAALRVLCPTNHPVVVRRTTLPADTSFGDAQLTGKGAKRHYFVRINKDMDPDLQIMILTHEWAHCMIWPIHHDRHPMHGPLLGVAWSEAYRAVYEDQ